jgi:predicted acylesterase/phospholipase RssA
MITNYDKINYKHSLFFCGGGWKSFYHYGIYKGLKLQNSNIINKFNYIGSSMGSFVAIISCCNIDIDTTFLKMTYELASNFENNLYNNIFSMGKQLRDIIEQCLPSNAYELASGRCFIVITTLSTNGLQQEIISEFYSQDDLLDALIASIYIPMWTGVGIYKYRNKICLDGSILNLNKNIYNNCIKIIFNDDNSYIKQTNDINIPFVLPIPNKNQIDKTINMGLKDCINFYSYKKNITI